MSTPQTALPSPASTTQAQDPQQPVVWIGEGANRSCTVYKYRIELGATSAIWPQGHPSHPSTVLPSLMSTYAKVLKDHSGYLLPFNPEDKDRINIKNDLALYSGDDFEGYYGCVESTAKEGCWRSFQIKFESTHPALGTLRQVEFDRTPTEKVKPLQKWLWDKRLWIQIRERWPKDRWSQVVWLLNKSIKSDDPVQLKQDLIRRVMEQNNIDLLPDLFHIVWCICEGKVTVEGERVVPPSLGHKKFRSPSHTQLLSICGK